MDVPGWRRIKLEREVLAMSEGTNVGAAQSRAPKRAAQSDNRLWIDDGGQISCPAHFGAYAAAELRRSPGSKFLATPLGTWERLSADDLEDLVAMGVTPTCETCAARERASGRSQR
jgi:hypothetical protein